MVRPIVGPVEVQTISFKPPEEAFMTVRFEPAVSGYCIGGPWSSTAVIEYIIQDKIIELMSFEEWLATLRDEHLTGEQFAVKVYQKLLELLGPDAQPTVLLGGAGIAPQHGPYQIRVQALLELQAEMPRGGLHLAWRQAS